MGLAAALFGYRAEEPRTHASPAEWMAYGQRQFFVGRTKPAFKAFARAAKADPTDPLPLAYRSWAGRLNDKSRAVEDSERAIALNPECAEAYMSLALAHATQDSDFKHAALAVGKSKDLVPADAYGSVLSIGVYLLFVDVFASKQQESDGFRYDFVATPLRKAADWLLSGRHVAALNRFDQIAESGRALLGALGMTATCWAMRDIRTASNYAAVVIESDAIENRGVLAAVSNIAVASGQ
jgi:tetratricopeptide (TPR) repeat protein